MPLKLYDRVALKVALPEHDVRPGDLATVVEFIDHPSGSVRGAILEFFNAVGESILAVTVPENAIEPLRADEVLSVRLAAAAH